MQFPFNALTPVLLVPGKQIKSLPATGGAVEAVERPDKGELEDILIFDRSSRQKRSPWSQSCLLISRLRSAHHAQISLSLFSGQIILEPLPQDALVLFSFVGDRVADYRKHLEPEP